MNETQYIKRPGDRAAWLELRRPYVGQSEAGVLYRLRNGEFEEVVR
jgi:hypothetical protein